MGKDLIAVPIVLASSSCWIDDGKCLSIGYSEEDVNEDIHPRAVREPKTAGVSSTGPYYDHTHIL